MASSLAQGTIEVLKATAPAIAQHGKEISRRMYDLLMNNHPQTVNLMDMDHFDLDEDGYAPQVKKVANALAAYAENCDNLKAISHVVNRIMEKHISFNILPEHYKMLSGCFMQAVKDALGPAATNEVTKGWEDAFWFLANTMMVEEEKMRKNNEARGGWRGFKEVVLAQKAKVAPNVIKFTFQQVAGSGAKVPDDYLPGQYLSIRISKEDLGIDNDKVRDYTLSSKPGSGRFDVLVRKGDGSAVSTYLHDKLEVGSKVEVGMPSGTCVLTKALEGKPLVLVAAEMGISSAISMLEHIFSGGNKATGKVIFVHCCKNSERHLMGERISKLAGENSNLEAHVFYCESGAAVCDKTKNIKVHQETLFQKSLEDLVPSPHGNKEYFVSGPGCFMENVLDMLQAMDVPKGKIHIGHSF